jgi:hypothetical protein
MHSSSQKVNVSLKGLEQYIYIDNSVCRTSNPCWQIGYGSTCQSIKDHLKTSQTIQPEHDPLDLFIPKSNMFNPFNITQLKMSDPSQLIFII